MFSFKQFTVHQDLCAMKVGTDGVLLGAWARVSHCRHILDIGTGTGLIALMAAQRSDAHVEAIDLDDGAVQQATDNVAASPWANRITVGKADVKAFPTPAVLFDAILCNPPFFERSLKSPDAARTMARHTDTLTFDELARHAARLLAPEGEFSVVIPYDRATDMIVSAASCGLFASRRTVVYPVEGGKPKRILLAFTRQGEPHTPTTLCLRDAARNYTLQDRELVEEFYLKL